MPSLFRTLKFQITVALLTVLVLFAATTLYTLYIFDRQRGNHALLNLATKLELTTQLLAAQAMNYKENAPRDYATYYRDVRLYYQDLQAHIRTFEQIANAFMAQRFDPFLTGLSHVMYPNLTGATRAAVEQVKAVWTQYRDELEERLGPNKAEPRLEWAAEYVIAHHRTLEQATEGLLITLQRQVNAEQRRATILNRWVLVLTVGIAASILLWFFVCVLRPLDRAVQGFRKVAQGEFGHQVEISGNNEIAWLTHSFNDLSRRLRSIFWLIDRIQQGSDLQETLRFVAEEFKDLLPLDWVGVLFVTSDNTAIRLEHAYANGQSERLVQLHFPLQGTPLERALDKGEPLHIPDLVSRTHNPPFRVLEILAEKGRKDVIFLPFSKPIPGALMFATSQANAYTAEHLELLTNIAHLITHSFARTIKLAEHARLAAIGQFASGVAHEIRSPLATIGMALDYFQRADLQDAGLKRAQLASREVDRVTRLLEDMLLYAKPMKLDLAAVDLRELLGTFLETNHALAEQRHQHFKRHIEGSVRPVLGDRDRLIQVFLNLARNACEAGPEASEIQWQLVEAITPGMVCVGVRNEGEPIPLEMQERLFEPFFTTKAGGTGLGLGIVKRIVDAHGGDIHIESNATGTEVTVTLPAIAP